MGNLQARGKSKGTAVRVGATRAERRISIRFVPKADVNARSVRSPAGSGCGLCQHREAVTLEYHGRRRSQKRQILDRPGLGVHGRRHRIDDRVMRIVGENADDFHVGLDLGIGCVDDAERRLAAGAVG